MDIFLTGARGYIGGSVARTLVDTGHRVRGLVRDADKAERVRAAGQAVSAAARRSPPAARLRQAVHRKAR
ncbi:MAG: NmrA family NAD(P)-binding protein [Burkholderiaceae bacterium]